VALPGRGFSASLGYTSTNFAGGYAFDYRVQGPAGFDQTISSSEGGAAGGACDPSTLTCAYGPYPYEWLPQPGPITVQPLIAPVGAKLAHVAVDIYNEAGIPWTVGAGGKVTVDMTGAYYGTASVTYYFEAPGNATPPTEITPTVALGVTGAAPNGALPLVIEMGAIERGNKPVLYEIQVQSDGGQFKTATTTTSPVTTVKEKPGHVYVVRVRATDSSGAASDWVASDPFSL
jgi:hypothetical protein